MAMAKRKKKDRHWTCRRYHTIRIWNYSNSSAIKFGRVYAAYGGIFVVMAIIWGLMIDKKRPTDLK